MQYEQTCIHTQARANENETHDDMHIYFTSHKDTYRDTNVFKKLEEGREERR